MTNFLAFSGGVIDVMLRPLSYMFALQYPNVTWPLFVAFLILMSILIMNLLVGLAVDDIKAVQEQAVLKRLGMQTQVICAVIALVSEIYHQDICTTLYTVMLLTNV